MGLISRSYLASKAAFRQAFDELAALQVLDVSFQSRPANLRGPQREPLTTDLCLVKNSKSPTNLLIVTSGIHGCELYSGSTVQRLFLNRLAQDPKLLPMNCAVALVHAVNPFGAAWHRRENINNVDLNRNFLPNIEYAAEARMRSPEYAENREFYRKYSSFLNCKDPVYFPTLRSLAVIQRNGYDRSKAVVLAGQRHDPYLTNYGGSTLQPDVFRLVDLLDSHVFDSGHRYATVTHLDIHTGIGPFGAGSLLSSDKATFEHLQSFPDLKNRSFLSGSALFPKVEGMLIDNLPKFLARVKGIRWKGAIEEYGTYHNFYTFLKHRNEHILYHKNPWLPAFSQGRSDQESPSYIHHRVKQTYLNAMCPNSQPWEQAVLPLGLSTIFTLLHALA